MERNLAIESISTGLSGCRIGKATILHRNGDTGVHYALRWTVDAVSGDSSPVSVLSKAVPAAFGEPSPLT